MEKFVLWSKTVLGIILMAAPTVLPLIGISFSPEDHQLMSATADRIIELLGMLLALYGRWKATRPLTVIPPALSREG